MQSAAESPWRHRLHEIIFEDDTRAFDVALLWSILLSVVTVVLESVAPIRAQYGPVLRSVEWFFTILFTVEYVLRLASVGRPAHYATSFFGVIDLMAIVPTYLSLVVAGAQALLVIRALHLLRIFRIFKIGRYVGEAHTLVSALKASRPKIVVFLFSVLCIVVIIGASMYLIEGESNGVTSIPRSMYWAIVTMTTVGYGNIAPRTVLGQALAAAVMVLGYSIIAVPTGIVSAELAQARRETFTTQACPDCSREGHASDARYCKYCGAGLHP